MKLTTLTALSLVAATGILISPSISQTKPNILTRPKSTVSAAARTPGTDKPALAASKAGLAELRLKFFSGATLTPAAPAVEMAGLYMEQVAQFDGSANSAVFYGSSGNASARFYPTFFEKSHIVEFTITNKAAQPVEFILDFGPSIEDGVLPGEGFTSKLNQTQTIPPGKHKISMVVSPTERRWYWVQIRRKTDRDLWVLHSAAVTIMK